MWPTVCIREKFIPKRWCQIRNQKDWEESRRPCEQDRYLFFLLSSSVLLPEVQSERDWWDAFSCGLGQRVISLWFVFKSIFASVFVSVSGSVFVFVSESVFVSVTESVFLVGEESVKEALGCGLGDRERERGLNQPIPTNQPTERSQLSTKTSSESEWSNNMEEVWPVQHQNYHW